MRGVCNIDGLLLFKTLDQCYTMIFMVLFQSDDTIVDVLFCFDVQVQ